MALIIQKFLFLLKVLLIACGPCVCFVNYDDPIEQDWVLDPNIFSTWPKLSADEMKSNLKAPQTSTPKLLPASTKPKDYLLKLRVILESELDEEELTASGSVRILIKCLEATDKIVMHTNVQYVTIIEGSVNVTESYYGKPSSKQLVIVNQTYEVENDFYIIQLQSRCEVKKEYFVSIDFRTDIATDSLTGLYLSQYTDPKTNVTKKLATTQFEDEHARKMFPSYDHPDFKARFTLIIGRQARYNSLSNMDLVKTEPNQDLPGWYWDYYAPTPVMSSYLVALVVSDFTCVKAPPSSYKKGVEVCAPPYMIENGGGVHSTNVVATVLDYYDQFMKQHYPLPAMKSIAIPDFAAGAMENWGINTYRIKGLIYYPNKTSEADRYRIELTIAHELAHQNFGNLVTMKFWNQIWLNEGFATYISFYGLQSVSPEYESEKQWITHYRRRALQIDGSHSTRPVVNISNHASYFDAISYSKGASLLRMMENFLTPKVFHQGLHFYLAKHAYDTATQWNLFEVLDFNAFTNNVKPPVATISEIMESWTLQKGFPLIRVEYISNRMIALSQERFFEEPQTASSSLPPTFWYVPIVAETDKTQRLPFGKRLPTKWLTSMEPTTVMYFDDDFKWLIVSPDASVFGRILYDKELSDLIEAQFNRAHQVFSAVTRAQIIEDAFENAWAGYAPIEAALNLTRYLSKENENVVWSSALNGFGKIYSMSVDDEQTMQLLKKYLQERVLSSLNSMGIEQRVGEKGIPVLHRSTMLNWGGILQLEKVFEYANRLIEEWLTTKINGIPPDLHGPTYCNAIEGGSIAMYRALLDMFLRETDEDVKSPLGNGLGCSKNELILEELRENLTDPTFGISSSLSYQLMLKLARNPISRKTLMKYLEENFYEIQDYFGGVKVFIRILDSAAQYWNTETQLQQLQRFIEMYGDELQSTQIQRHLQAILKGIKKNIEWRNQFAESIKMWLLKNQ